MSALRGFGGDAAPLAAVLLMVGAGLNLSLLDTTAKYLVTVHGHDPLFLSWVRFAVHALCVLVLLRGWSNRAVFQVRNVPLQALRGLTVFATTFFAFLSLRQLQLAEMISIFFLSPLLITVLSVLVLRERIDPMRWATVLVGFGGVLLIVRPGHEAFQVGHLHALMAMVSLSVYALLTRHLNASETRESQIFYSGLMPAVILLPGLGHFGEMPASAMTGVLVIALGVFGALSHWLLIRAYVLASPSKLATYPYLQIVWMTLLGYLVFAQLPDLLTVAGAGIIIASGLALVLFDRWRERRIER